eukprot:3080630-Alexandrium_andersonii.AAC.1
MFYTARGILWTSETARRSAIRCVASRCAARSPRPRSRDYGREAQLVSPIAGAGRTGMRNASPESKRSWLK